MQQVKTFLPTTFGNFYIIAYADTPDELMPHLALVHEHFSPERPTLLRIHSECMTGDIFASRKCDCGEQLVESLRLIAEDAGVLLYLRQEGRGIGLINKLKAYNLQANGMDTVEANLHLGFQDDARQYEAALEILNDLNIRQIKLLTNNPLKIKALEQANFEVIERVPLVIDAHKDNEKYMETKRLIMGHLY
jgi:GTP cyclohydrolase II